MVVVTLTTGGIMVEVVVDGDVVVDGAEVVVETSVKVEVEVVDTAVVVVDGEVKVVEETLVESVVVNGIKRVVWPTAAVVGLIVVTRTVEVKTVTI